jgi:hypothetical protein
MTTVLPPTAATTYQNFLAPQQAVPLKSNMAAIPAAPQYMTANPGMPMLVDPNVMQPITVMYQ